MLGLFFISVGMTIDFGLLATRPATVAFLLVGFLALKIATLWWVARAICVGSRERWLFALILSQGGEFAFVVFGSARSANVLTPEWQALLTIVVALSMATTPLLLRLRPLGDARVSRRIAEADTIEPRGPVIIAGSGRFGQIVGRLLLANDIRAVVLDRSGRRRLAAQVRLRVSTATRRRSTCSRPRGRARRGCW